MTKEPIFSQEAPNLLATHFRHLHEGSGISVEVILERGYTSILGEKPLADLGFSKAQRRTPGTMIPLWGVDGQVVGYVYRPDRPRSNDRDQSVKYENIPRSSLRLDCPPRCKDKLSDPSDPLWITEGVKKVDALASHGLCGIGLSGVWGFKGRNQLGGITLLADWDEIALNGRTVYVVFDSDVMTKPAVGQALQRLSEHLRRRGAEVHRVLLPSASGAKVGVDDFLLDHSVNDLTALAEPAGAEAAVTSKQGSQLNEIVESAACGKLEPKTAIEELRGAKGQRHKVRSAISHVAINSLRSNGFFVRTHEARYYFYSPKKELLPLDSFALGALLNMLFGLNQSEPEFRYVLADANTEAHVNGKKADVYQLAFYDRGRQVLYLDRFDGRVYRLDGARVQLVDNGTDGVLFNHPPEWEAYEYLESMTDLDRLMPTVIDDINFVSDGTNFTPDEQRLCISLWLLSIFFESIQPTKPLLLLVGEKGSGKTTALRRIIRLLLGQQVDVSTMEREREDAFVAVITSHPLAVFDNVDGRIPWLNDRLATAATGGLVQRRRLYSTNELATYRPRCFIALTSRQPNFKRDDVADRLLILTVGRLDSFRSEEALLENVSRARNELWTELINDLNSIVGSLSGELSGKASGFRLADWANLCLRIAEHQGLGEPFSRMMDRVSRQQSTFALEDDPLYICLQMWLDDSANHEKRVDASLLFAELQKLAGAHNVDWPYRNVRSLAKRLGNIKSNLQDFLDLETKADARNRRWYSFRPKSAVASKGVTI